MLQILEFIPKDLPPWAWVVIVIASVVGAVVITKLTGNNSKQSIGSNNKISGGVNMYIGNKNDKDKS